MHYRTIAAIVVATSSAVTANAQRAVGTDRSLVLANATVIDGTGAPVKAAMSIVVRDGVIVDVFATGSKSAPEAADEYDLAGAYVMPGLIDSHVHIPVEDSGYNSLPRVERRLAMTLFGGITYVREMFGDVRVAADLARRADMGEIPSPRIAFVAAVAGERFRSDRRLPFLIRGNTSRDSNAVVQFVNDASDVARVVSEARSSGAVALKLYGALSSDLATRLIEEAKRQGLPTWAHLALAPASPNDVIRASPNGVSHVHLAALATVAPHRLAWDSTLRQPSQRWEKSLLDTLKLTGANPALRSLFASMAERGIILEPTLVPMRAADRSPRLHPYERRYLALAGAAHDAGVRIAAGTDLMIEDEDGSVPSLHLELELLVRHAKLTPMEAIVAATRTNAEVLGIGLRRGTLAVGKAADILVLRRNPLDDIRNTRSVWLVIKDGAVVHKNGPLPPSPRDNE